MTAPLSYAEVHAWRRSAVTIEAERAVLGVDGGAMSYTTIDQAHALAEALQLRGGMRVLDIGCGRGWPGAYLAAERSEAEFLLSDVPSAAVREGRDRARGRPDSRPTEAMVASGTSLPFQPRSFDAVMHSDVLC
ncbi:MAG TPA: methyltransferase domain-containing protein [Dehalococcoidia bacterium]|nr:methyltransferase domain-containing protein [Dehalococcoidia bacterium]